MSPVLLLRVRRHVRGFEWQNTLPLMGSHRRLIIHAFRPGFHPPILLRSNSRVVNLAEKFCRVANLAAKFRNIRFVSPCGRHSRGRRGKGGWAGPVLMTRSTVGVEVQDNEIIGNCPARGCHRALCARGDRATSGSGRSACCGLCLAGSGGSRSRLRLRASCWTWHRGSRLLGFSPAPFYLLSSSVANFFIAARGQKRFFV